MKGGIDMGSPVTMHQVVRAVDGVRNHNMNGARDGSVLRAL